MNDILIFCIIPDLRIHVDALKPDISYLSKSTVVELKIYCVYISLDVLVDITVED